MHMHIWNDTSSINYFSNYKGKYKYHENINTCNKMERSVETITCLELGLCGNLDVFGQ